MCTARVFFFDPIVAAQVLNERQRLNFLSADIRAIWSKVSGANVVNYDDHMFLVPASAVAAPCR